MTSYKYMSDGLGGHVGLSCSPGLGSAKRVTKNKTHILLFNILLVFLCKSYSFQVEELSLVLDFQRSNKLYKLIKFPHARRIHISICTIFYQYMFLISFISNLVLWRLIFLLQTCLPNNLRTFTTKDLLFGCENASEQDNQSLFLQVQDFIVNSGRFP